MWCPLLDAALIGLLVGQLKWETSLLDIKFIRHNIELIREGARNKRFDVDLDRLLTLDDERKAILQEQESLKHDQKLAGKRIATLKGAEKQQAATEMGEISKRVKDLGGRLKVVLEDREKILIGVPNPPAADVPVGKDDGDNVELRVEGAVPQFDFDPKDHVTLGLELGILDLQRASKIAGSQTYILLPESLFARLAVDALLFIGLYAASWIALPGGLPVLRQLAHLARQSRSLANR